MLSMCLMQNRCAETSHCRDQATAGLHILLLRTPDSLSHAGEGTEPLVLLNEPDLVHRASPDSECKPLLPQPRAPRGHSRSDQVLAVEDVLDGGFGFAVSQAGPSEDRLPQRGEGVINVEPEGLLLQHPSPHEVPSPYGGKTGEVSPVQQPVHAPESVRPVTVPRSRAVRRAEQGAPTLRYDSSTFPTRHTSPEGCALLTRERSPLAVTSNECKGGSPRPSRLFLDLRSGGGSGGGSGAIVHVKGKKVKE